MSTNFLATSNPNFTLYERGCGDCLKHNDKPIWIVDYPPIAGYRTACVYHAYKGKYPPKKGAMFWTVDNEAITPKEGLNSLEDVIKLVERS